MRLLLLAPLAAMLAAQQPNYEVIVSKDVRIAMRDGTRLTADIYRPGRNGMAAEGRFPALLERTPYGPDNASAWAAYFVPRGYVVIGQNVRGRWGSEGRWRAHQDDPEDGYDTAQWIGQQPWSDGGIGTFGTSYPGATQHALALANAPNLKTMVPIDAMSNYGRYGLRHNGAFELRFFNWIFSLGNNPSRSRPAGAAAWYPGRPDVQPALAALADRVPEFVRGLPLRAGTTPLKFAPDYESWLIEAMSHGDYDDYWQNAGADVVAHAASYKDIPVYHVSGWYDSWTLPVANLNYVTLSKEKKSLQRLIMGPWTHGGQRQSFSGEGEFGPEAALDFYAFHLRWFDHWLKGVDNGVERDAPVRLFVMGGGDAHKTAEGRIFVGGKWRDEREWPVKRAQLASFYLRAGGSLSQAAPPDSAPTRFLFDPRDPVPTIGGNISSEGLLAPRGAADQRCRAGLWTCKDSRPLSARNDVLVFQTPPLESNTEVTGRLVVTLYASSSAVDTDFTAKLVDVYPPNKDFPAGVDLLVGDSIVRGRYRDSLARPTPMKPGEVYKFTIELYPTSLVFQRGHRIRLDISSSNFPRFDVNPNTGEPLNDNRRWAVAENAVYHDPAHPAKIDLPLVK